jgi:hypothetical protein
MCLGDLLRCEESLVRLKLTEPTLRSPIDLPTLNSSDATKRSQPDISIVSWKTSRLRFSAKATWTKATWTMATTKAEPISNVTSPLYLACKAERRLCRASLKD